MLKYAAIDPCLTRVFQASVAQSISMLSGVDVGRHEQFVPSLCNTVFIPSVYTTPRLPTYLQA